MVPSTPVTYSADEAGRIREMLVQPHGQLVCPRCSDDLLIGAATIRNRHTIREVFCPGCHRCLMVRDVEEETLAGRI